MVVELYVRFIATLVLACRFAGANEVYGLDIADEVVLLGPAVHLICELECAEVQHQDGLGALLPVDAAEAGERVQHQNDFFAGELL